MTVLDHITDKVTSTEWTPASSPPSSEASSASLTHLFKYEIEEGRAAVLLERVSLEINDIAQLLDASLVQWAPAMARKRRETRDRILQKLAELHIVTDKDSSVPEYLVDAEYLVPLLEEARIRVNTVFGPDAPLELEVMFDPEDSLSQLFLYIHTLLGSDEAGALTDQLDDAWWLSAMPRARGKLVVALRFG